MFLKVIIPILLATLALSAKRPDGISLIENIADLKEFKKLIRTKTNVLILYSKSAKEAVPFMKLYGEVAEEIKGQATLAHIDCSGDGKKLCRKHKVSPEPILLKHYKDGAFNKDYDRKETVQSMVNFLKDPTGDPPWEEDETEVVHIPNTDTLGKLLHKEKSPILIMFYAPWCGFCKRLKPEYAAAAAELKGEAVLAAMDVNRPENSVIRRHFNITGFPTLLYFENGNLKMRYEGENNKEAIIKFMKSPVKMQVEKPQDSEFFDGTSPVTLLTDATFDVFLEQHSSVLVMFFAPWCGHCKKLKPEYIEAATYVQKNKIPGRFAAVDATKEKELADRYQVSSYPTTKYFRNGKFEFDVSYRTADKLQEFMENPQEPPPPPPPEVPWHENPDTNVNHLTEETFKPFLKRKKHVLVMFYAPWCGHCKKAKPEFEAAATHFKGDPKVEFAALDCTAHSSICASNGVKAYPTFIYFNYFKNTLPYERGRTEEDFVKFMQSPSGPPPPPSPEDWWKELPGAEHVNHLDDTNFKEFIGQENSLLVMFYAPWCGHCQSLKPNFAEAASILHKEKIQGKLAAVDATVARNTATEYDIKAFPTLKYFRKGKLAGDYTLTRTTDDLVKFMKTPPYRDEL